MSDLTARDLGKSFPDAAAALAELGALTQPTGYARGRLAALRLSRLEPLDRNAAESLARRWGLA